MRVLSKNVRHVKSSVRINKKNHLSAVKYQSYPGNMWQMICLNSKEKATWFTVDHYSDFFKVDALSTKDNTEVIKKMKTHFARYGKPELTTDNGPRSMHTSLSNLHKLMDFNMSPVLLVIRRPMGKPKMQ